MLKKPATGQDHRNLGIGKRESALAFGAAMGAALIAREALKGGWRRSFGREPPKNPVSPEVEWKEAILWGVASGALVGLARLAARRLTSQAYRKWC